MAMERAGAERDEIRIEVLKGLAEQAMSDAAFRAMAREDLTLALATYGYELNQREFALVARFRASLADAGVNLDLVDRLDPAELNRLIDRLADR